ncbi:non-ribosomal peptide synthetase modules domain protein [Burkholderia pseudomallei]|nr:non-ribosomal peptide synthetase modules domain protein [Burkholderia pseudomallei]
MRVSSTWVETFGIGRPIGGSRGHAVGGPTSICSATTCVSVGPY